jgi:hypothetical protein
METRLARLTQRLRSEGEKLVAYLQSFPEEVWGQQIYPGENGDDWDLRQLLWHLVSAERGFNLLLTDILAGGEGAPADMDIDAYNREQVAKLGNQSPAALLKDFRVARETNIDLVENMTDSDLDRQGNHPYLGWTDLESFFKLIYRHGMLHMRDVKRKVN